MGICSLDKDQDQKRLNPGEKKTNSIKQEHGSRVVTFSNEDWEGRQLGLLSKAIQDFTQMLERQVVLLAA